MVLWCACGVVCVMCVSVCVGEPQKSFRDS